MKCSIVLCVGTLVALVASKPTDKLNRNHSSLTVVSSAVVAASPSPVDTSDLIKNFRRSVSNNHKRARRSVWGDGKKCSTGKIRVGQSCVSCAILQKQNPHACKHRNDTLGSQMANQETLPQQWRISTPNSDSDIISSTRSSVTISSNSTFTTSTTTTVLYSGFTEASIIQSTSSSSNFSSNNYLVPKCLYFVYLVFLILYLHMTYEVI